jgi:hypothetical protein
VSLWWPRAGHFFLETCRLHSIGPFMCNDPLSTKRKSYVAHSSVNCTGRSRQWERQNLEAPQVELTALPSGVLSSGNFRYNQSATTKLPVGSCLSFGLSVRFLIILSYHISNLIIKEGHSSFTWFLYSARGYRTTNIIALEKRGMVSQ